MSHGLCFKLRIVASIAVAPLLGASLPAQNITFQSVGAAPAYSATSKAAAVSQDGQVVVGVCVGSGGGNSAPFRWSQSTGLTVAANLSPEWDEGEAIAVSADGSVAIGKSSGQAFRWLTGASLAKFADGNPAAVNASVTALSPDGSRIAGLRDEGPFQWTESGGFRYLAGNFFDDYTEEAPVGVTSDGKIMAGNGSMNSSGNAHPYRWTESGGFTLLETLPGASETTAHALSADGTAIVGETYGTDHRGQAFLWSQNKVIGLGDFAGGDYYSFAAAVSANGAIVVGTGTVSDADDGSRAFRWDPANGMQQIQDILEAYGVDLSGWTLTAATGVSADGSVIVGFGRQGRTEQKAWIATGVTALPRGRPKLKILGKNHLTTKATRLLIRGTADGVGTPIKVVQANLRRTKYRKIHGRSHWSYRVKLKKGRNSVFIRAIDSRGIASIPTEILIIQK